MPIPTDHGCVVITNEPDGTKTVIVCSDIVKGHPVNAYAMHVRSSSVVVDPNVKLDTPVVGGRGTKRNVTVFSDTDGTVRVMAPRSGRGPLLS